MAGRHVTDGSKQSHRLKVRRRPAFVMGGAVSAFLAAAAMATGSATTAAPAKADFEDLLDPIIQPILTQVTDSLAGFDPALATDLTSWTDTFLADLNSLDSGAATASTAVTASALSASPSDSPTSGTYDIPITMQEGTEPTVQATVDGTTNTLLVDTGSSGLVIPWQELGSNDLTALEDLFKLGFPSGLGESGYSGGVDYFYLTYGTVPVDYDGGLDTTGPVDVEIFSWPTSLESPANFQDFLSDDGSTGILGIGDLTTDGGPSVSPLEQEGYDGVTVDLPQNELIVDPNNPFTAEAPALSGAPT
jgi:hypothetical protein